VEVTDGSGPGARSCAPLTMPRRAAEGFGWWAELAARWGVEGGP